jgi:hypothetical protein
MVRIDMLRSISLLAAVALLVGCALNPSETTANLGQQFDLAIGQTVSITGEDLSVKFVEVIGDSRCPTGATCIWQGEISTQVEIRFQGDSFPRVLTQPGLTQEPSAADFNEYEIAFDVLPYPEVGKQIQKSTYRLQLTVIKSRP